jgi:hypothetical protein
VRGVAGRGKTTAEMGNGKQKKWSSRALEDCFVAVLPYGGSRRYTHFAIAKKNRKKLLCVHRHNLCIYVKFCEKKDNFCDLCKVKKNVMKSLILNTNILFSLHRPNMTSRFFMKRLCMHIAFFSFLFSVIAVVEETL